MEETERGTREAGGAGRGTSRFGHGVSRCVGGARHSPLIPLPFIFLTLACTSITARPSFRPLPLAPADTVAAQPAEVIEHAGGRLSQLGLSLRISAPAEGYLETRWYHPETKRSSGANEDPEDVFRVRVFADLVTPSRTRVVVESVYRRAVDPSIPDRVDEHVAAEGTPGDSLAIGVLASIAGRFAAVSDTGAAAP